MRLERTTRLAMLLCALTGLVILGLRVAFPETWFAVFTSARFLPRRLALSDPLLTEVQAISDLAIGIAYVSISISLLFLYRRIGKAIPPAYNWILVVFSLLILSGSMGYFMAVLTLWYPYYWVEGLIDALAGIAAVLTALGFPFVLPRVIHIVQQAAESERRKHLLHDATQHNQTLQETIAALRASEARYRRIFEAPMIGLLEWRQDGETYVYEANQELLQMLHCDSTTLNKALSEKLLNLLGPSEEQQARIHEELATTGTITPYEATVVRLDGSSLPVLIGASRLSDKNEGVCLVVDIYIRKGFERGMRQALEEAQRALAAREEFLSVAAHELKTPITSLRGFAQILIKQIQSPQPPDMANLTRVLTTIHQQTMRLSNLTDRLLDISRLESNKLLVTPRPTDLVILVRGLVESMRPTVTRHQLNVQAPAQLLVEIDPERIEQVVSNLIDNAVKYSPHGGDITVTIAATATGDAAITVCDQGIGINDDAQQHMFERFYQADSHAYCGMGIGLYISKQIIDLHHGSIAAHSNVPRGTCFTVTLPATARTRAPDPAEQGVLV